jgi:hypothetical protein
MLGEDSRRVRFVTMQPHVLADGVALAPVRKALVVRE